MNHRALVLTRTSVSERVEFNILDQSPEGVHDQHMNSPALKHDGTSKLAAKKPQIKGLRM